MTIFQLKYCHSIKINILMKLAKFIKLYHLDISEISYYVLKINIIFINIIKF